MCLMCVSADMLLSHKPLNEMNLWKATQTHTHTETLFWFEC